MVIDVELLDDPTSALQAAGGFLAGDPVRHNLILTLLETRVRHPTPGRYWVMSTGDGADRAVVGVALQSPTTYSATITPMPREAAIAAVDAIVDAGITLPGVMGEPATAAAFAGHWTERTRSTAAPTAGQRLYEVEHVVEPRPTAGAPVVAAAHDRDLLVRWFGEFARETGSPPEAAAAAVDRRLPAGHIWLWSDGDDHVAMTAVSDPVAGVARIAPVYTPRRQRGRGYASNLVGHLSRDVLAAGNRCMLYTDLANPTSNAVYRALGYRAVDEAVRYTFAAKR